MAQYYQVLSQSDKNSVEELRQYYPNIVENQTVQYVISPEHQQHLQGQQIIVTSGDQLMVVDSKSQPIIVEQPQISYQTSGQQYIVQEANVKYQAADNHQVFYTEESGHSVDAVVEQPLQQQNTCQVYYMKDVQENGHPVDAVVDQKIQQPIILNHQLQSKQLTNQAVTINRAKNMHPRQQRPSTEQPRQVPGQSQVRQQLQPNAVVQQMQRQMHGALQQQVRHPHQVSQQRPVQHVQPQKNMPNRITQQPTPRASVPHRTAELSSIYPQPVIQMDEMSETDKREAVALADGTVISVAEYKKLREEEQLKSQALQDRLQAAQMAPAAKKKPVRQPRKNSNNTNRGGRNARGKNSCKETSPVPFDTHGADADTIHHKEHRYIAHPQLKMLNQSQQQYAGANVYEQQQQVRKPSPAPVPQQQQQYLIYPHVPQRQASAHNAHCGLPSYVPSSQIQQIIESTPVSEEESIRMLVLLENGEQRLITFTLPKEACTIQEILEQVGVPFKADTNIEVVESTIHGLHYIVTVGRVGCFSGNQVAEDASEIDTHSQQLMASKANSEPPPLQDIQQDAALQEAPEQPKEFPKFVPGKLAVCGYCGYLSEDFNKCLRCKRKLPEDVKAVPASLSGIEIRKADDMKCQSADRRAAARANVKPANGSPKRRLRPKFVETEPVILTLSSDEEEEAKPATSTEQVAEKLTESSVIPSAARKEPSVTDMQQNTTREVGIIKGVKDESGIPDISVAVLCRTIRIGSYRFFPADSLKIKSTGLVMKVPSLKDPKEIVTVVVERHLIVKVLVSFQKMLPVIFYYVRPSVGSAIREQIGMVEGADPYFDPLSNEEAYKRITVLPEYMIDDAKSVFRQIYGKPTNIMDELTGKEANDILLKTCPKELAKVIPGASFTEIKQLLIYPPGKGGLPINTEDYLCLAQDQFLNDVIIDFYLKYLLLNLAKEQQEKVHVFSTFFYKRLTTKPVKASRRSHPSELDPNLTAAQKRHARVKNWTKNVNLFEKDFIIIPINENCHWFLAIICFPGLNGTFTMDNKPIKIEPKQKKKKPVLATIGNVTITSVKTEKEEKPVPCEEPEISDKDEAEGDDSELDSEEETEEPPSQPQLPEEKQPRQPIKQPCILIFDSLAGASRSRVVATLRDYLTCEHKAKLGIEKVYNKDVIKGACPKVPQQTNFTDCGLYLLQYVEQFFKEPIKDYHIPIPGLKTWFDEITVTKKREDISLLIKSLMTQYNIGTHILPDIVLPTADGKIIEHTQPEEEEEEEEEDCEDEDDEMLEPGEVPRHVSEMMDSSATTTDTEISVEKDTVEANTPDLSEPISETLMPSQTNVIKNDGIVEQTVPSVLLKPDLNEFQKQSSDRDTMMYLKSKRINRHKNNEGTETKKIKVSE